MAGFPAVKLNQLYSIQFYESLNIIFENINMIDMNLLEDAITNKTDTIILIPYQAQIDTMSQQIIFSGHKLNDTTYFMTQSNKANSIFIPYECSNSVIWQGIEYLYHLIKSK